MVSTRLIPRRDMLINGTAASSTFYAATIMAIGTRRDIGDICGCLAIVSRQRAQPIQKSKTRRLHSVLLSNQVAHERTGDECLPLQHAAHQNANVDQHDGDFDQRKPLLPFHVDPPNDHAAVMARQQGYTLALEHNAPGEVAFTLRRQ
jgi:hypothetical protein